MYFEGWPNPNGNSDIQIFKFAATGTDVWKTWHRPPGKTMCSMFLLGGAGGGGGGFTGIAGSARGGGGGGGSSAQTTLTIPLCMLGATMFVQVGGGGQGTVSGGGAAGNGVRSYVAIAPDIGATNVIAVSGAAAGVGGTTGTGAGVGSGGTAGSIATFANMPLGAAGQSTMLAGQNGNAGGAQTGAVGVVSSIPTTGLRCMGASGGAGTTSADFAGGAMTGIADSWLSEQRPAAPAAGSFNGSGGVQLWTPFFGMGALGGSSSNTGIGGAGGPGAYGGGGGGGGGGTTGGRGGPGGNGIVIIVAW